MLILIKYWLNLSRAWTITGIAVRHSMALGLHLRNDTLELSETDKESRVCLWWSIYSLECLLNEVLGRPSCISDREIGTPMPSIRSNRQSSSEMESQGKRSQSLGKSSLKRRRGQEATDSTPTVSSGSLRAGNPLMASPTVFSASPAFSFPIGRLPLTPSTYLVYRTQLCLITHEILAQLYCATLIKAKWSDVQDTIRKLDGRLKTWKDNLTDVFDFDSPKSNEEDGYQDLRKGLNLFYNSSRMTLFRSALCRIEGRIMHESHRSKNFNAQAVTSCVQSATNVITLLPSLDDPKAVYDIIPWWTTIHYIIAAASVLMLELAFRAEHVPTQGQQLVEHSKLAVRWLAALADQSIAARKGWEIFDGLLRQVAPIVGGDLTDLPRDAPIPNSWKGSRFGIGAKIGNAADREDAQTREFIPGTLEYTQSYTIPAWIEKTPVAMPFPYTAPSYPASPLAMFKEPPVFSETDDNGLRPMQRFAGAMQNFPMAGHMLGRLDEFRPWENSYFAVPNEANQDMHLSGRGVQEGIEEDNSATMQDLQLIESHGND